MVTQIKVRKLYVVKKGLYDFELKLVTIKSKKNHWAGLLKKTGGFPTLITSMTLT